MKRSSSLSALLVGLSLTVASTALAAPATEGVRTTKVALAQPSDPQQPSTGSSPTQAPSDGSSTTPQPAVSVGTSTPTSDTPSTAPPEEPKKPARRPFAGSALFISNAMTTGTVFQGQHIDYNPTVESSLFLLPRYAINDALQLRARMIVSYEWTNSDMTTYRNEPMLSDLGLQLFYRKIPKVLGFSPAIAANVGLPTSKGSRSRTLLFSPGATLQLARGFEHVLGGELMVISSLTYTHPILSSRNPVVADDRPYAINCVGGANCSDLLNGSMNVSDALSYSLILVMEWGKWSPAIMYLGGSQWAYTPTEATNPVGGGPIGRPDGFEPTTYRQTHYVSGWLDYTFNSWLTAEIGYQHSVNGINGGGQRSNVLFDRYAGDSRVYLGASIQLDNLVKALQGGDEGAGGVVRAKNTKSPMFTF